jgi:O-acetyl-ADP-ribose deacetylase (regulator of RNase III)
LKVKSIKGIRCPTGEAKITLAGLLTAKYVIHTVGSQYKIVNNPKELLESCYKNCLALAIENNCKSIAFPAISCGVYGYPLNDAAEISLNMCSTERV